MLGILLHRVVSESVEGYMSRWAKPPSTSVSVWSIATCWWLGTTGKSKRSADDNYLCTVSRRLWAITWPCILFYATSSRGLKRDTQSLQTPNPWTISGHPCFDLGDAASGSICNYLPTVAYYLKDRAVPLGPSEAWSVTGATRRAKSQGKGDERLIGSFTFESQAQKKVWALNPHWSVVPYSWGIWWLCGLEP